MGKGRWSLSVAHRINLRAFQDGRPWKRITIAQLRAKERRIAKRAGELPYG